MDSPTEITAIEALSTDGDRFRIRVGRRSVAILPKSEIDALQLAVGTPWNAEIEASVADAALMHETRRDVLRMLGRRALATATIRARLQRRGRPDSVIDRVIERLGSIGLIDDHAFAIDVAEAALRRGPLGTDALAARLERRGVDASIAGDVARELTREGSGADHASDACSSGVSNGGSPERSNGGAAGDPPGSWDPPGSGDQLDRAVAWGASALRRGKQRSALQSARRVAAGLARRGLDADTIRRTLARLELPAPDDEAFGECDFEARESD